MEEISDYTSEIIEFKPVTILEKHSKLIDTSTVTDPLAPLRDISTETSPKCNAESQTKTYADTETFATVNQNSLAQWLRKIYPTMEAELLKGLTPLADNYIGNLTSISNDINIQTYQKISISGEAATIDNSQGLATWLSVHTNNAPVLVVTTVAPHDDWCEHVNQSLHIFVPKRVQTGNFIVFTETKKIPIKACLKSLTTNAFNKSIFVGSAFDGDIYIWRYEQSTGDVTEVFNFTTLHGYATAMDWGSENRLLTCHANGFITQWLIGKQVIKEIEFFLQPPSTENISAALSLNSNLSNEITTLVSLSLNDFVVGTKDGGVYHCWSSSLGSMRNQRNQLEVTRLNRHLFMVSSLLKTKMPGYNIIISCDLSGKVLYHDIRNSDDENSTAIVQIPLPFKNSIGCSREGNFIYCPGNDGSLECYSLQSGTHSVIKGALRGRGSVIKCSDNGFWIVTGLYTEEFQIFYVKN